MIVNKNYGEFGTSLIPIWSPASDCSSYCSWKIGSQITVEFGRIGKKKQHIGVVVAFREMSVLVVWLKPRITRGIKGKNIICEWVQIKDCTLLESKVIEEWLTSDHPILRPYFLKCLQCGVSLLIRSEKPSKEKT
jgi:hypothetical protein